MLEENIGFTNLKPSGVLSVLDDHELESLGSYGKFWKVGINEEVIGEGDTQDCLYVVLSGKLDVYRGGGEGDGETSLGDVRPGESFGEMCILDKANATASATVRAMEKSVIWQMPSDRFDFFIERHPLAAVKLVRSLAVTVVRRLRDTIKRLPTEPDRYRETWW